MPAVKIQKFLGTAPKVSPPLLPDAAAQEASEVNLSSGALVPRRAAVSVGNSGRAATVCTIYPMVDPDDGSLKWLSWLPDVDVVVATSINDEEQRIYYTGDGVPKVTNYELAVAAGGPPYPYDSYDLGLPLPTTVPSASAASYAQKTISTYARDSGQIATIVTSTAHGLKSGAVGTISGFNDVSPDTTPFNSTNVVLTVVNSTTLSYFNTGSVVTTIGTDTDGKLDLAGGTIERSYLYTWMTPWGEESVPSEPSDPIFIKEGQVVTVSGLPNTPPAGDNFIRGIRLYRLVTSVAGSAYLRLRTIWFPVSTASASRTSNVVTVTMAGHHNLLVGDRFKITGVAFGGSPDTSFDITDGTVLAVTDHYTFTYTKAGSDKATTATTAGSLQCDVSEPGASSGVYYSSTTFTDDFDVLGLLYLLESEEYDAPDEGMIGLVAAHNNILAGFVGNELCLSEPNKPWAWPISSRIVLPHQIVGLAPANGNSILVLTDGNPYIVVGSTPQAMQPTRLPVPYPCVSKRSIVDMGYGITWASHGGLVLYGGGGVDIVTKMMHDWDTWETIDHDSLLGSFYNGAYLGCDGTQSFLFERGDQDSPGSLTTTATIFDSMHYSTSEGFLYFTDGAVGDIYEYNRSDQPSLSFTWKSKEIVTPAYLNIGAARVVGDYGVTAAEQAITDAYNAAVAANNAYILGLMGQLGTINGPVDYTDTNTSSHVDVHAEANTMMFNGSAVSLQIPIETAGSEVTFTLWADSNLVFSDTITSSAIFRLPNGYRSDTFEVQVSGQVRIEAIHLGETPLGLNAA
jgi:hypothetical protein